MKFLDPKETGLLVIDIQERIFPALDRGHQVVNQMVKAIKGAHILGLPLVVSEHVSEKLGPTLSIVQQALGDFTPFAKSTFSAAAAVTDLPTWILCGVETQVCVLQTAKELIARGTGVVILADAVTSRSVYDLSIGIAEARDVGARITCVETVLTEMVGDAAHPAFKEILQVIK